MLPERRSAEVTPAVCKASAGAVEHLPVARVRNLADFLGEAKAAGLLVLRGRGRSADAYTAPDYRGASCSCSARRAAGCARGSPRPATTSSRCPLRGRIESLNVSAAAAVLMYEILQQRLDTST